LSLRGNMPIKESLCVIRLRRIMPNEASPSVLRSKKPQLHD